MRRSSLLLLLFLAGGAAGDARAQASGCDDLLGLPVTPNVDYATQIKPILNELVSPTGRCTSCHLPEDFLNLTDLPIDAIYRLVNEPATLAPLVRIEPGDPQRSWLFIKLNCAAPGVGDRMPRDGTPLTIEEQGLFYDWIFQGARGEPVEEFGEIFRDFLFRDGAESIRQDIPRADPGQASEVASPSTRGAPRSGSTPRCCARRASPAPGCGGSRRSCR